MREELCGKSVKRWYAPDVYLEELDENYYRGRNGRGCQLLYSSSSEKDGDLKFGINPDASTWRL